MSSRTLVLSFARRMVDDLATNNVLRGSWAEQLVAHFAGVDEMPPNWTYYDLRTADGCEISVKHSVGPRPSFVVAMSPWAWDPSEGWLGADDLPPQYWCHAYVFAWLDAPTTAPELDLVLDPTAWRFAVLSRADMYQQFVVGRVSPQKTCGLSTLQACTEFIPGSALCALVADVPVVDDPTIDGVPARHRMRYDDSVDLGAPTRPEVDVVPEATVATDVDD